jgi:hypothetical protein
MGDGIITSSGFQLAECRAENSADEIADWVKENMQSSKFLDWDLARLEKNN